MRQHLVLSGLTLALATLVAAGCGGDGGGIDLAKCGNGTLDSGEACDDGNLSDFDACLSTCVFAYCGDGFVEDGVEACEIGVIPKSCAELGFSSGTPSCTTACTFDTSGCSGNGQPTPTPTPIATDGGPTPTTGDPTGTATPTPQATPIGSTCAAGDSVVVILSLDAEITSARLDLGYPAAVNLPGSGTDASVKERVAFAGSAGLTVVNDSDQSGDLVDDTVTTSFVGSDVLPAGTFVTISFDCVDGQPSPSAGDFVCTVTSASLEGNSVDPRCALRIE